MDIDNKLRINTVWGGLNFFLEDERAIWRDWRLWPQLGVARDMESSGNAGMNALLDYYGVNACDWPDQSHAIKCVRDIILKALGLYDFVLLMLLVWNLHFSPDDENMRRDQFEACMRSQYDQRRPHECPCLNE